MTRSTLYSTLVVLQLSLGALAVASDAANELLMDDAAWTTWSSRPELAPRFAKEPAEGRVQLSIAAAGDSDVCGCWVRRLPKLAAGRRYRLQVEFQTADIENPGRSVWALIAHNSQEYAELSYRGSDGATGRFAVELKPSSDLPSLELRLYFAWASKGQVRFTRATLVDITDQEPADMRVRLAAVSGRPVEPKSPQEAIDFYCERLDAAAANVGGVDLVCLPEVINVDGVSGDRWQIVEPIPGPLSDRLAAKARQHRMYVAASLLEREGERLYNTGVLYDRIVGKYRKTHPTIGEAFYKGVTPGDDYPVFDTDIGRIGYMVCYDNHYPEVARVLSLKGAQIILHSNMADNREEGSLWEPTVRTRAVDNNVHLLASCNSGRSCIVSPRGEVLAMAGKKKGEIVRAECDLSITVRNHTKRDIGERYLQLRRADTFEPLTHDYWRYRDPQSPK
jgi:predicted amidohydrolase